MSKKPESLKKSPSLTRNHSLNKIPLAKIPLTKFSSATDKSLLLSDLKRRGRSKSFTDHPIDANDQDLKTNPITKAIKQKLLDQQRKLFLLYLINQLGKDGKEQEKLELINEFNSPASFYNYCLNPENDKKITQALEDKDSKFEYNRQEKTLGEHLESMEIAAYQQFHEDFKEKFSEIKWPIENKLDQSITTIRTTEVAGLKLQETTYKLQDPIKVINSKGEEVWWIKLANAT
jgi:hypothetical protein